MKAKIVQIKLVTIWFGSEMRRCKANTSAFAVAGFKSGNMKRVTNSFEFSVPFSNKIFKRFELFGSNDGNITFATKSRTFLEACSIRNDINLMAGEENIGKTNCVKKVIGSEAAIFSI